MFDILVYLFENYYAAQAYPDYDTLERKLHAAGFENEDIHDALVLDELIPDGENRQVH